jgi:hypothetical protein
MVAFTPRGPLLSFIAAGAAPTSVQAISLDNVQVQQISVINTDTTNDCVIGWGQTDAIAKLNAAAGATVVNCKYLLHATDTVITVPPGTFVSGISVAGTATVKVQAGIGN